MSNFLTVWASGVVIAVIIGSIIEMILPESNNKKYVKTIIGIFILFTIISPVIFKFSGEENLKNIVNFNNYISMNMTTASNIGTNDKILELYEKNLKNELSNCLKKEGYEISNIKLDSNIENGNIEKLELNIIKTEKSSSINKINTTKININISIDNNLSTENSGLDTTEKNKIKDILFNTYGIAKDKIYIK